MVQAPLSGIQRGRFFLVATQRKRRLLSSHTKLPAENRCLRWPPSRRLRGTARCFWSPLIPRSNLRAPPPAAPPRPPRTTRTTPTRHTRRRQPPTRIWCALAPAHHAIDSCGGQRKFPARGARVRDAAPPSCLRSLFKLPVMEPRIEQFSRQSPVLWNQLPECEDWPRAQAKSKYWEELTSKECAARRLALPSNVTRDCPALLHF